MKENKADPFKVILLHTCRICGKPIHQEADRKRPDKTHRECRNG